MSRLAAALVALAAWAGLVIQFQATFDQSGSLMGTIAILLRYFTVLTNLLVALTFTAIAIDRRVSPVWLGGVTLAIVLVGIVHMLLLRGLLELSGGALVADALLHKVVPILVPLYWLLLGNKGGLRWRHPFLWTLYPLLYLVYALVRGHLEGRYAYPFIDVAALGPAQAAVNTTAIALGFILGGLLVVAADSALARRSSDRTSQ